MTPESWRRVGELFHEALDVPTSDRSRWLDSACAGDAELLHEVNSLLRNDQDARGFVQEQVKAGVQEFVDGERAKRIPERVGPYRLIHELGQGGMGTVYLAERDDEEYKIDAAIKLVTPGMDTDFVLQRFRKERQILAQLDHPNIARLLDGGTSTEGLPYIVMEYVPGQRISEFCAERRLSTGAILGLFLDVCAAVAYAHRKFVVHRDLKPGNILVTADGAVKLLDFGICKVLQSDSLLGGDTVTDGGRMMTPDYASPEQIRGDPITIGSDVYSLAAVLYELLTGQKPHRFRSASLLEVERAICKQEIVRPSAAVQDPALSRQLRGDLDQILLHALAKEPKERYESVDHFADDIRRHLDHLPVRAHQPRLSYRLRKLVARNKVVCAAAAVVAALLVGGTVFALNQSRSARAQLGQARTLAHSLLFDIDAALRDLSGAAPARAAIARAEQNYFDKLAVNAADDPDLQAELARAYMRLGEIQLGLKHTDATQAGSAAANFAKARRLLDQALQHAPDDLALATDRVSLAKQLAQQYAAQRDLAHAKAAAEEGRRVGEVALNAHPNDENLRRRLAEIFSVLAGLP